MRLVPYHNPAVTLPIFEEVKSPINYQQASNNINDFKRQPLLINPLSFSGPCLIKGDVNGDGLEDIYAGGGSGKAGCFIYSAKKRYVYSKRQNLHLMQINYVKMPMDYSLMQTAMDLQICML